jgi:phenylalanyl-tRNA synthetase alpha subunit
MIRTIKLENKKLLNLLTEKGDLINTGREVSDKVESYEKEMEELDLKVQEAEKKVDITDLTDKEKEISDRVQKCIDDMNAVKQEIYKRMSEQVDHTLHEEYEEVKKRKEQAEEVRNKIAIKIQKFNDKIIPLTRTLMKPFIEDEYEDYDTIKIEDGEIVATIFSHLDDFKDNFKKK